MLFDEALKTNNKWRGIIKIFVTSTFKEKSYSKDTPYNFVSVAPYVSMNLCKIASLYNINIFPLGISY